MTRSSTDIKPGCDSPGCFDHPATPAPLDPSKVKAGDTVTVTGITTANLGYVVTGVVWEPSHSPGSLWVGPVALDATSLTLTDHQPAPEPEPEWKPGTVWADQEGERYWFTDNGGSREDGEGPVFRNDVGDEYETSEMGDVRPLVVIDPATARHEVTVAVHKAHTGNVELTSKIVGAVLLALGIEAP